MGMINGYRVEGELRFYTTLMVHSWFDSNGLLLTGRIGGLEGLINRRMEGGNSDYIICDTGSLYTPEKAAFLILDVESLAREVIEQDVAAQMGR